MLVEFLYCDRGALNPLGPSGRDSICSAPAFTAGLPICNFCCVGTVAMF